MTAATQKLNIPKESEGYIRIPYSLASRNNSMTSAGLMLYAFVFSHSCLKNDPSAVCRASYTDFMSALGIGSRSTPSKELDRLEKCGLIERHKRFHAKTEYTVPGGDAKLPAIEMEQYFMNRDFYIPREMQARKLRPFEALILALIATHTKNPAAKGYEGSISQIADMLGVCTKTVRMALDVLISAKLVRCQERYFRCSYSKTLHLRAPKAIVRTMRHKRRKQPQPQERRSEMEIAADVRTARERFYAARRQYAEAMADSYRIVLESDKEYVKLQHDVRALDPQIARAVIAEEHGASPQTSEDLRRRQKSLQALLLERMAKLNISPPQIEANTYVRCKKCSDTGWLPNGKMCDCYTASKEDEEE